MNETSRSELDLLDKDLCFSGWVMTYRADSYFCRNVPLICVRFVDKSSKKVNSGNSSLQKTTEGLKRTVALHALEAIAIRELWMRFSKGQELVRVWILDFLATQSSRSHCYSAFCNLMRLRLICQ